jgi:hypothetical protein
MRARSIGVLTVVVMAVLSACGASEATSSDTTFAAVPDVATTTTAFVATPTDPPTTAPTTTSSTTTTTTSTTTSTTSSTTTPPTTLPDNCLEGSWWLSPEGTTNLYANLLPGFPVTVTGTHWAEFAGDTVDFWVILEVRFNVGALDVTFGVDQHGRGTYTVADDVLTMNYDTFESTIHEGHGAVITDPNQHPGSYADDVVDIADNGDGTITINRVTIPLIEIPPVAGGPMGCDGDTMSLGYTSGLADTVAVYTRQA